MYQHEQTGIAHAPTNYSLFKYANTTEAKAKRYENGKMSHALQ